MFSGYLTCHLYFYNNLQLPDWLKGGIYESIDYRNDVLVMTAVYIHALSRLLRTTSLSVVKCYALQIESLLHSTLHYLSACSSFPRNFTGNGG